MKQIFTEPLFVFETAKYDYRKLRLIPIKPCSDFEIVKCACPIALFVLSVAAIMEGDGGIYVALNKDKIPYHKPLRLRIRDIY